MPVFAEKEWQSMLNQLADRDAPVELSRRSANDDRPSVVYRTRLFGVREDGYIAVERNRFVDGEKPFGKGDDIELTLMHNNERLVGTCTIADIFTKQINQAVRRSCYLLSPARRPMRDQRRSFYRVSVAAVDMPQALITSLSEDAPFEVKARIVNISAGGLGVSVRASRSMLNQIKKTHEFNCVAQLTRTIRIDVPIKVCHVAAISDDGLYLGMKFRLENECHTRALEDQMLQLCTQFQREALQRRRA